MKDKEVFGGIIDNIISEATSVKYILKMYNTVKSSLPTDKPKNFSTIIFYVALYRFFRRTDPIYE